MGYLLGVDVGTSFTAAALCRDDRLELVSLGTRSLEIPSVVYLDPDQGLLIGEAAERRGLTDPTRVAREFKRRLGDPAPILIAGTPFSAEGLMAAVLKTVIAEVTARQGEPPTHVTLTRPANWGPYKCELFDHVPVLADAGPFTTTTEPEAAAAHFASTTRVAPGGIVAVYDLGGGTFDAAVLRKTDDGFEILGVPEGIEHLGGADFDDAVFDHVRRVLGSTFTDLNPLDPTVRAAAARLRAECVQAKEGLSRDTDTTIPVSLPGIQTEVRLTRQEFEDLIRPSLMGTVESLRRALRSARITPDQVAATVLAGGSSRIPLVAELIGSELRLPVAVGTHPKHAVALGAALIATRDADHPPHDRPTTAMAPIGTATPHLTTEHWDTNRLQTITGDVAAIPEPPTGELTYDQPGNTPRRRRRWGATAFAALAVAIVVAAALVLVVVHPWRKATTAGNGIPTSTSTTTSTATSGAAPSSAGDSSSSDVPSPTTSSSTIDRLLAQMTLDEKLSMIEGQVEALSPDKQYQAGYLPGVPRLGIPSLRLSDGPPGVVTKQDSTGMTATMGVAATFSDEDAKANGSVIGSDARALGQDLVLEPFVNYDRDTSWSRGFNTFGEDPLLTSNMGANEIQGIQSQGVMAQVKHYIAYDGASNVSVDEQTLHEIYLAPFDAAVKAGVSSIMCSYNAINSSSVSSCGDQVTLTQILRTELGFKGFVTSDWGANHSTLYLNAGLDMEMPGGVNGRFSANAIKAAIQDGSIQESRVTEAVGRILYEYNRFGLLDGASKHTITSENRQVDNQVVQQTSEDAAVLLKNDGDTLPLPSSSSLALIGPTAAQTDATDGGGERSGGIASEQVGTYQVLQGILGSGAKLTYAVADDMTGTTIPASAWSRLVRTDSTTKATRNDAQIDFTQTDHESLPAGSGATWTGTLTIAQAGTYWIDLQILGATGSMSIDGKLVVTAVAGSGRMHATGGNGPLPTTDGLANFRTNLALTAGPHAVALTETADASGSPVEVRVNWTTPSQKKADHDAAVNAAKNAAVAVVFAWAPEKADLSVPLPDGQDALIADIAQVNPNTVVVLNTSQPIAMPWLSRVKSVLEMWYPGDRGGYATANVLLGTVNPGGKLPFTWPQSIDQELAHQVTHPERNSAGVGKPCPGYSSAPWECGLTTYSEGVDIGYRFFLANHETPLFPFGFGLSYGSSFTYSGLRVAPADDGGETVTFQVTNAGPKAADAVPQAYLGAPTTIPSGTQFAPKALAGYTRIGLAPGETKTVSIHIPKRQLQYWSTTGSWTTATGTRTLYVSTNATTDVLQQVITVTNG